MVVATIIPPPTVIPINATRIVDAICEPGAKDWFSLANFTTKGDETEDQPKLLDYSQTTAMAPEAIVPKAIMNTNRIRACPFVNKQPKIGEDTIPARPNEEAYHPIFIKSVVHRAWTCCGQSTAVE
jgi:hypothetical protein